MLNLPATKSSRQLSIKLVFIW